MVHLRNCQNFSASSRIPGLATEGVATMSGNVAGSIRRWSAMLSVSALAIPAAMAQAYSDSPALQGHVMGGYSFSSGNASNYLDGGWIVDGGLTFWPRRSPIGFRTDLSYDYFYTGGFGYYGPYAGANHGWAGVASLAAGAVFEPYQYGWARLYEIGRAHV